MRVNKKGLYIISSYSLITDEKRKKDGVTKKIISQVDALTTFGFDVELVNVVQSEPNKFVKFWYNFFYQKWYFSAVKDYRDVDFVYIRFVAPMNSAWLFLSKYFNKMGVKVIYEIPTFPYKYEHKGVKGFIILSIDRFFRTKLKKYVDYIATYSEDDWIFGIKTIKITNGIDCSKIKLLQAQEYHTDIRLICVAGFSIWHGYDRLIKGLYEYYRTNPNRKVYFDLVGDGGALHDYKQKILQYELQEYITCYGMLSGEDLTSIFDKADIAVCSLGCHRKDLFLSSELKSREYMARGLPMISSARIDILSSDYQYIHYVPEDESPIDIQGIINFYDQLTKKESRENQINNIRRFAERNCDMNVTMQPIIKALTE